MNPSIGIEIWQNGMIPLDLERWEDIAKAAVHNIKLFDHNRFTNWVKTRPGDIQKLAKQCPPDRIYRIIADAPVAPTLGRVPNLFGIVIGYQETQKGSPPNCAVQVLGIRTGNGAYDMPLLIPGTILIDVTEDAKAGKIAL